jgi:hypothetical protein
VIRDTCTITVRSKGRCGSTEPTDTQDTHGQDLQVIVVLSRKAFSNNVGCGLRACAALHGVTVHSHHLWPPETRQLPAWLTAWEGASPWRRPEAASCVRTNRPAVSRNGSTH